MDIPSLEAFVAVADHSSFSLAAERLHLTQPAVSKRITALEHELDAPLFDRIGRQIFLTEAGNALLPRARLILSDVEDTRRALSNLSDQVGGRLCFGTSHHIGLHHLPPVLRAYSGRYPAVELDIRFLDSETACQQVEAGALELAVVTLPAQPREALTVMALWPDPLAFVTSMDHPLAHIRRVTMAQLVQHAAILPARNTYTREIVEQALQPRGLQPNVALSTNYLETIKMLVTVGLGWSVLPLTMVDQDLHIIEVPGLTLERTLGVVVHHSRTLSNSARAMAELLKKRLSDTG